MSHEKLTKAKNQSELVYFRCPPRLKDSFGALCYGMYLEESEGLRLAMIEFIERHTGPHLTYRKEFAKIATDLQRKRAMAKKLKEQGFPKKSKTVLT